MNKLIESIIENLTDDLLKPEYLLNNNRNRFTGHCYVATETLYHLLCDDERIKYTPAILKIDGITHWFLKNKITNEIIDITKDQFNYKLDYTMSINKAFLTKNPSKRSLILLNRINEETYLQ